MKITAYLENYTLAFTRLSKKRSCGVADIVFAEGATTWGVVWELSDGDLITLDRYEGVHIEAYRRIPVTLKCSDGARLEAYTYEVINKSLIHLAPNSEYILRRLWT